MGEGLRGNTYRTITSNDPANNDAWKHIHFQVFDTPMEGRKFEDRQMALKAIRDKFPNNKNWTMVVQVQCMGVEHMDEYLKEVEGQGYDGVMLRKPQSLYFVGQSPTLLKLKVDAIIDIIIHPMMPISYPLNCMIEPP